MKFVLINSWYNQYSTGKLVYAFRDYLNSLGYKTKSYYGHGNSTKDIGVRKIASKFDLCIHGALSRITGYQGCFSTRITKKLIKEIDEFRPDVVYLFNLHAYYLNEFLLLNYLKQNGVEVVYILFDEYPYLGKCCFAERCHKFETKCCDCPQIRKYPKSLFFDRSEYFFLKKRMIYQGWRNLTFAGVKFLSEQAAKSGIAKKIKFKSIDMGVQLKTIYYPRETNGLREKLKIPSDNKVVITVGQTSDPRKGIKKFFDIARKCEDNAITFINIGFNETKKILPSNCIGIAYVTDQNELAMYYSLADVYVMTSSGEAMSLTCMEALGCGAKLVGFNISGTPYACGRDLGVFVEYDNLDAFAEAIKKVEKRSTESVNACRAYALSRYEISDFVKNLADISLKK